MSVSKELTDKFANALQSSTAPTLKKAYIKKVDNDVTVCTSWSQTNYQLNKKHEFNMIYSLTAENMLKRNISFPIPMKSYELETASPTAKYSAGILKQKNQETLKEEFILEIWCRTGIVDTLNLSAFDQHGIVHSDIVFGSLSWSQDETKLVYVAEKKKQKSVSFFEQKKKESRSEESDKNEGEKYLFEESWGEQLTEVINPVICILNIKEQKLKIIENIPADVSPAQPVFRGNDVIVFEGIKTTPFRLGRIYCENRESQIYSVKAEDSSPATTLITSSHKCTSYCPRVSPNGETVLFLHKKLREDGDAHRNAENVVIYNFQKLSMIEIEKFQYNEESSFIFVHSLPSFCWFNDNIHVALACFSQFKRFLCVLNTDTQKVVLKYECNAYFGVYADLVLTSYMKLDSKNCILQVSTLNEVIKEEGHEKEDFNIHEFVDNNIISYGVIPRECQMVNGKHPIILWPHGGPHSVFTDIYSAYAAAFCKLGFAVILTNYRGSTSDTAESLYSLPGNVGLQDVQDVKKVLELFLGQFNSKCDSKNIFMFGGSHGGFLTAHHVGQFPSLYRAAVLRNPVIDVSTMSGSTDIIDWNYFEAGISYHQNNLPNSESISKMLEKSPIIYIKNIKAPILLCIGLKDARVPPSQGTIYYKLLKANNKQVKMLAYPNDCHPLSTVETEGNVFVNVCKWFYENAASMDYKS